MYKNKCASRDENHCSALDIVYLWMNYGIMGIALSPSVSMDFCY